MVCQNSTLQFVTLSNGILFITIVCGVVVVWDVADLARIAFTTG